MRWREQVAGGRVTGLWSGVRSGQLPKALNSPAGGAKQSLRRGERGVLSSLL